MSNRATVAVIIPIYKNNLTYFETLSLNQCFKVLYKHPIIFVAPSNLNLDAYHTSLRGKDYLVTRFDDQYFGSIDAYNKMMLSPDFYKCFLRYKFILIYQLDAFVFKDDLLFWCARNYDYIGAPHVAESNQPGRMQFLKNYNKFLGLANKIFKLNHKVSNVGNGGFSLRKTLTFYWLLKILKYKVSQWGTYNEDFFFRYWGNIFYPVFKLPTDEEALAFSIEVSPKESLEKLNNELPFGCHAFERYGLEIWAPFLSKN